MSAAHSGTAAGGPQSTGLQATKDGAERLLDRQNYSGCLSLLEAQPREVLEGTCMVEYIVLRLLSRVRLFHQADRELAAALEPHEPRIMGLMGRALRAKSLDVEINRSLGKYHSLVDWASRACRGHESMLDDPGFWPWLDGNYPHVAGFLRSEKDLVTKTNSLVQMLSVKFKSRVAPHSRAYMGAVDGLCRQVMDICAGRACTYAKKASDSWLSAKTEMTVLVAISRNFRIMRIDPEIPRSGNLADVSFEHDGIERYVEVYSHAGHDLAAPQTKRGINPRAEWKARFHKAQIRSLREAGVPAVYVMNLNDFQAQPGETRSPEFCVEATRHMPPDSDIVVILHGIEAASLRGGRAAGQSALAARLKDAIWEAMPENVAGRELQAAGGAP